MDSRLPDFTLPTPEVATFKLDNGVDVTVIDAPHSFVADVRFIFNTGFRDTTVERYHLPHIFEHLIMESRIEGASLSDRLLQYGADANAATSFDEVMLFTKTPASFVAP